MRANLSWKSAAFMCSLVSSPAFSLPTTHVIDATSAAQWTYVKLHDGELTTSGLSEEGWHIAVKRTQFQTNSGTSGEGAVGVFNTEIKDFALVTRCAPLSLSFDEILPASGAPGSVETSGSPVLNAWYDYDMSTHRVSSKKDVYLVVTGVECYKLQITDYKSGKFSVEIEALPIGEITEKPLPVDPVREVPEGLENEIKGEAGNADAGEVSSGAELKS